MSIYAEGTHTAWRESGGLHTGLRVDPTLGHLADAASLVLEGRKATAYPGVLQAEAHPEITGAPVTRDGTVITSRSAGTALDFALEIVSALAGDTLRREV